MKSSLSIFIFIGLFSFAANAQEIIDRDVIFIKNLNSLYQNPEQTIKVANYLFENSESKPDKAKALYLASKSKILQGNFIEGVEDLFKAREILKENESPFISSLVLTALSERFRISGINDVASNYLNQSELLLNKISLENEKTIAHIEFLLEQWKTLSKKESIEIQIQRLKDIENITTTDIPILNAIVENKIGQNYLSASKVDSAEIYYNKSISILKNSDLKYSSVESVSLQGLGNVFFKKENYNLSKGYFIQALQFPIIEKHIKVEILNSLSEIYKNQDSAVIAQKYYNEKAALNAAIIDTERELRSVIISHIDAEQQSNLLNDKRDYFKWGVGLAVLFLLIFVGYYFYNRKLNQEYKRFQKVIAQVEKDKKLEAPFSIDDTSLKPSKGIVIPEETEKNILERLEEFESTTKFANSNMNLSLLAKQMKTNSKYISEIIHTHKQKNFNTYINELRVNYIIHLMKTDKAYLNYKVSYLAETCGFSSHSAFTVVFKSITGFTPKQFIAFLKKSKKEKMATF